MIIEPAYLRMAGWVSKEGYSAAYLTVALMKGVVREIGESSAIRIQAQHMVMAEFVNTRLRR